jgi:ribosomal protein L15E
MAMINVHKAKDGSITYRVRVRRKGERIQTASFPTRKEAKRWATMIEGQMIEGRHFPVNKPACTLTK